MKQLETLRTIAIASLITAVTLTPFQLQPTFAQSLQEEEKSLELVTNNNEDNLDGELISQLPDDSHPTNHSNLATNAKTCESLDSDSPEKSKECSMDITKMSKEMSEEMMKMSKMMFHGISYGVSGILIAFYFLVVGVKSTFSENDDKNQD